MSHACPRCSTELLYTPIADVEAESCESCCGIFLTPAALVHLATDHDACVRAESEIAKDEYHLDLNVRYLPCPTCGTRMNHKLYGRLSKVVVDMCRDHGVWFDKGGLPTVLHFVANGGLERAKKLEAQEHEESARAARVAAMRAKLQAGFTEAGSLEYSRLGARFQRDVVVAEAVTELLSWLT